MFVKNRQGLTAREYAQKVDRFKFHRVVKLLRQIEQKALDTNLVREEMEKTATAIKEKHEDKLKTEAAEPASFLEKLAQDKALSISVAALLGILLFLVEKFFFNGQQLLATDANEL